MYFKNVFLHLWLQDQPFAGDLITVCEICNDGSVNFCATNSSELACRASIRPFVSSKTNKS